MSEPPVQERILRAEKVKGGMMGGNSWLTLTTARLLFTGREDLEPKGIKWEVPLESIESVRAKKAFRAGTEVLEVHYRNQKGKRDQKAFERFSAGAWANSLSGTGRSEPNSFATFETQILQAREAKFAPSPANPQASGEGSDLTSRLAKLSELRQAGVLSEEEFVTAKAKVLSGE
jgi:hypothetical protein